MYYQYETIIEGSLLIAPFGIEIRLLWPVMVLVLLLIAPFGIEITFKKEETVPVIVLLIAPFGIEMTKGFAFENAVISSNRTVWN